MSGLVLDDVTIKRDHFSAQISVHVQPGHSLAIVGPNGSGKSTVLEVIAGFLEPVSGSVTPGAGRLGYVPQDGLLIGHLSVRKNIGFGLNTGTDSDVDQILTDLELVDLADRRPTALSGGEQQRVALARALVRRPSVLLLDEPLSKVDVQLRQLHRQAIEQWSHPDQVKVIVTHGADHARDCDNVLALDHGHATAYDTPAALADNPPTSWLGTFFQ